MGLQVVWLEGVQKSPASFQHGTAGIQVYMDVCEGILADWMPAVHAGVTVI
ncbi:MAG TPA: hypothetical protein VIE89_11120 [Candidatus Binatia bacterium]